MPDTPATALLVVNLGTPEAPTPRAVRRYLAEFLHDHRVVQLTRWLWCPLLHFIILPLRGPKVAHKYASIWMGGGSPLAVHTRGLAEAMQAQRRDVRVAWAMRYGNPSIASVVDALRAEGVREIVVLPLYPQYSTTTTASVQDAVDRVARSHAGTRFRVVRDYHVDAGWVAAVADSIRAHWAAHGRAERLLFSFHGIPARYAAAGDRYGERCRTTARLVAERLGLPEKRWSVAFQSRVGRARWLEPYTEDRLRELAVTDGGRLAVVCPGFAVDCLETLEEIAIRGSTTYLTAGGADFEYVPALNDDAEQVDCLARRVAARLGAAA